MTHVWCNLVAVGGGTQGIPGDWRGELSIAVWLVAALIIVLLALDAVAGHDDRP